MYNTNDLLISVIKKRAHLIISIWVISIVCGLAVKFLFVKEKYKVSSLIKIGSITLLNPTKNIPPESTILKNLPKVTIEYVEKFYNYKHKFLINDIYTIIEEIRSTSFLKSLNQALSLNMALSDLKRSIRANKIAKIDDDLLGLTVSHPSAEYALKTNKYIGNVFISRQNAKIASIKKIYTSQGINLQDQIEVELIKESRFISEPLLPEKPYGLSTFTIVMGFMTAGLVAGIVCALSIDLLKKFTS